MRAVQVVAADGTPWTVRVEWLPRWRALARRTGGWRRRRTRPTRRSEPARETSVDAFDLGQWTVEAAPPRPSGGLSRLADGGGGAGGGGAGGGGAGGGSGWDLGGDELPVVLLVGLLLLGFVVAAALGWFVVLPAFLLVLDGVVVAVLLVAGTLGRVLLRRPWTVAATTADGYRVTRGVVGWRAALRRRDEVAAHLQTTVAAS